MIIILMVGRRNVWIRKPVRVQRSPIQASGHDDGNERADDVSLEGDVGAVLGVEEFVGRRNTSRAEYLHDRRNEERRRRVGQLRLQKSDEVVAGEETEGEVDDGVEGGEEVGRAEVDAKFDGESVAAEGMRAERVEGGGEAHADGDADDVGEGEADDEASKVPLVKQPSSETEREDGDEVSQKLDRHRRDQESDEGSVFGDQVGKRAVDESVQKSGDEATSVGGVERSVGQRCPPLPAADPILLFEEEGRGRWIEDALVVVRRGAPRDFILIALKIAVAVVIAKRVK